MRREEEEKKVAQRVTECNTEHNGRMLPLQDLQLVTMPASQIRDLRALRHLNAYHNKIEALPTALWTFLPDLQIIDLSQNQLVFLPQELFELEKLRELNVSQNKLAMLPDNVGKAITLTHLCLAHNKLRVLPESLGELLDLTELDVSFNQLIEMPHSSAHLERLEVVDLSGNKIGYVPESIKRLHDRRMLLHSRTKRKELISRALRVRTKVSLQCQRELQAQSLRAVEEASQET